jgi:hypothetical protein
MAEALPDRQQSCRNWMASDVAWQALVGDGSAPPTDKPAIEKAHQHAMACR